MISSQMLKGTLEGCILQIISRRETYGYEIAETGVAAMMPQRRAVFLLMFSSIV